MKDQSKRKQNEDLNLNKDQQSTTIQLKDQLGQLKGQFKQQQIDQSRRSCDFNLSERLFETYTQYFHKVLYKINKPLWLSLILLFINFLQMQILSFTSDLKNKISNLQYESYANDLYNILEYSHFLKVINIVTKNDDRLSQHIMNIISFSFNLQFLLFLTLAVIMNLKKDNKGNILIQIFLIFESIYLQLFGYIFYVPQIYSASIIIFNDNFQDNPIQFSFASISLILTIIVGFIFHTHDFDYRFILCNHLSKRHSNWSFVRMISETLITGLFSQGSNGWLINLLLLLTGILNILEFIISLPFYSKSVQVLFVSLSINRIFMSLIFFIYLINVQMNSLLIVQVCVVTICFELGRRIHSVRYRYILFNLISLNQTNKKGFSPKLFDQITRYIYYNYDYFYEDYMVNKTGVFYETVYLNHIQSCFKQKCYCHSIQTDSQYDINFLGDKNRKSFMDFFLMEIMENYINQFKNVEDNYKKFIYTYINFLIDVKSIPQKVSYELLKMKNNSLHNYNNSQDNSKQTLGSQKSGGVSSFVECLIYEQMKERSEKKFSLYYSKDEFQNQRLNLELVIEFDDLLNSSHIFLQDIVYLQGTFYAFLSQDYLNIEQIENKGRQLKQRRDFLKQYIQRMFDINYSNSTLIEIALIYSQSLDFENKSIREYIKQSKRLIIRNLKKEDLNIDLFKNESCTLKISLLSEMAIVKQVSSQFETILGYSQKEIQEQKASLIVPGFFQKPFQDYIHQFINSNDFSQILCSKMLVFPLKFQGFILPMYMRCCTYQSLNDFGVCAYLEKDDQKKQYIIIDDSGLILDISEEIFNCAFSFGNNKLQNIKRVDLLKILPVLGCLLKSKNDEQQEFLNVGNGKKTTKEIQTLMIINPRIQKQYIDTTNSLEEYYKKTFSQFKGKGYRYILIQWSFQEQLLNQGQSIKYVQITKFRKLDTQKYANLITMQIECAKHFMNTHLDLNLAIDVASYINLFQAGVSTTLTNQSTFNQRTDTRLYNKTFLKSIMQFESLITSRHLGNNYLLKQVQQQQNNQANQSTNTTAVNSTYANQNHSSSLNSEFQINKQLGKQLSLIQTQAKDYLANSHHHINSLQYAKSLHPETKQNSLSKLEKDNIQESSDLDQDINVFSERQIMNKQATNINLEESEVIEESQQQSEDLTAIYSYKKKTFLAPKQNLLAKNIANSLENLQYQSPRGAYNEKDLNLIAQSPLMPLSPKFNENSNLIQEKEELVDQSKLEYTANIEAIDQSHLNPSFIISNNNLLSGRAQPIIVSQKPIINLQSSSNNPLFSLEVFDENHIPLNHSRIEAYNNTSSQQISLNNLEKNSNSYNKSQFANQDNFYEKIGDNIVENNRSYQNLSNQSSLATGHFAYNNAPNNQYNINIPSTQVNNSNNNTNNNNNNNINNNNNNQNSIQSIQEIQAGQSTPTSSLKQNSQGNNVASNLNNPSTAAFLNKKFNSTLDGIAFNGVAQQAAGSGSNMSFSSTNQINSITSLAQLNNISNKIIKEDSKRRKSLFSSRRITSPTKKQTHVSFKSNEKPDRQANDKNLLDLNKYNFDQFQFYGADKSQEIWEEDSSSGSINDDSENFQNKQKINSLDVVNEEAEIMDISHFIQNTKESNNFKKSKKTNVAGQNQDSIHSSQTQNSSRRLYVIKVVRSKKLSKLFITANIAGYIGLLLLLIMTSGLYAVSYSYFQDQYYSMVNMPLFNDMYSSFSHLMKCSNQILLYKNNYFQLDKNYLNQLQKNLTNIEVTLNQNFKDNLYQLVLNKQNMDYLTYAYNTKAKISIYPTPYVYDNVVTLSVSILYSFIILCGYLYKYIFPSSLYDAVIGEVFSVANLRSYQKSMDTIQSMAVQFSYNSFNQIDNNYNISLSIIIVVSFIVTIIVYFMNIMFITNRENILKLFATFSPELLQRLINNLDEQLKQLFSIRNVINSTQLNTLQINVDKKGSTHGIVSGNLSKGISASVHSLSKLQLYGRKTISLTNSLPKFSLSSMLICLLSLVIVATYPVVNLVVKNNLKKESQTQVQELNYILSVPAQLGQLLQAHYGTMGWQYQGFQGVQDPNNIYYNMTNLFTIQNQVLINNLYSLLSLSQSFQRDQQSNYNKYFYPLLDKNVCEVLKQTTKYNDPYMMSICSTVFSGIFEQGYIIALKNFLGLVDQLSQIYNNTNSQQLQATLIQWNNNINQGSNSYNTIPVPGFVALDDSFELIIYISGFLKEFVIEQYQNTFQKTQTYFILLFVYSLLIFILLFLLGWYQFFNSQLEKIYECRNLLTIFQIQTLLENPYIMSYFKQIISYSSNNSNSQQN
ncbi:transmembrane protein, putative (macronuclear) [Tetrahymena thermophila SB210]|uniref:Transmembrane protein, putative n=1 Tax=Tetrahymena thermophila (strain SB210) TaxID=312017 RepID=I7M8F8_TETTS|nr:transmembrane protein, putative [Tetrahymena thermophila SB210]EAR97999.2 transmembrane protein, putative [Tetrahymena thermophila SB210]|eukprot:XP_001018244.2 transmembrane protein, putative [Tetrahymena thermophila SB210]